MEEVSLIDPQPAATTNLPDKVIEPQVESDRSKLAGFRAKLAEFEQRHGMTTVEFQARFDAGDMGDAPEWFDWDGYATLATSLEDKLKDA